MKKTIGLFYTVFTIVLLSACGNSFNADTARDEAREKLQELLNEYEHQEVILTEEEYTEENIEALFTQSLSDYFTDGFKETYLQNKLENIDVEDRQIGDVQSEFIIITRSPDNTIKWLDKEIVSEELDENAEAVYFYIDSSYYMGMAEMIIEDGEWKVNNLTR